MGETIKEMQARHEKEIEELQNNCSHGDISSWLPFMWAPGHQSGEVRVCNICGKIMDSR